MGAAGAPYRGGCKSWGEHSPLYPYSTPSPGVWWLPSPSADPSCPPNSRPPSWNWDKAPAPILPRGRTEPGTPGKRDQPQLPTTSASPGGLRGALAPPSQPRPLPQPNVLLPTTLQLTALPWVEQEPTAREAGEQKEPLPGRSLCRHPNSTQGCQGHGGCSASSNRAPPSSLPYPSPGFTLPTQLQGLARPRPEPDTRFSRGWRRAERGSILTTTRSRSSAKAPPSPVPVRCRRGPSQPVPRGKSPHADRRGAHRSSLTSSASARTGRAPRMSHIPKGCSPAPTCNSPRCPCPPSTQPRGGPGASSVPTQAAPGSVAKRAPRHRSRVVIGIFKGC